MLIREVRLLVRHRGDLRRLCKFRFGQADGSLYVFPYAPNGRYFFGSRTLSERQSEDTFNFKEHLFSENVPHLSIHESGQVHAYIGEHRAGPLSIPHLSDLRGEHIGTISVDRFDGLGRIDGEPRQSTAEPDLVIQVQDEVESGRLALFANGARSEFGLKCMITFGLSRPSLPQPLYLGLAPITQDPLGAPQRSGIVIIAGWNPTQPTGSELDYLFIRGE
jgi:hypothetical protein